MMLQEHFYITSIYKIPEHREATHETATKIWYYKLGKRDLHAVRARNYRLAEEMRLSLATKVRRYFNWYMLLGNGKKRMITSLRKSEGTTLTTHREMRNYTAASYACLYARMTAEEATIKQVGKWVSRRLTPQGNMRLAGPITLE
jgi:hypothetical protein